LLTSGASCPDSVIEGVLRKLHSFFPNAIPIDDEIERILSREKD
jgi:4-hydroxy-3-methylbut-2-enyl diphosphate reductase